MIANFHEGIIFTFFVSQEPFTKIKITNFVVHSE